MTTQALFAGLDADQYPGDDAWSWLAANTPVRWTGAYLAPAPDHRDTGWMTRRAAIEAAGVATVPVFLGRQFTGPGASAAMVNGTQGRADAHLADVLMRQFGKPPGAYCFLDRETPDTGVAETNYVTAWAVGMESRGWSPGLYISHLTAPHWARVLPRARLWVYALESADALAPLPTDLMGGHMRQFAQDRVLDVAGRSLLCDFNASAMPDPSAP